MPGGILPRRQQSGGLAELAALSALTGPQPYTRLRRRASDRAMRLALFRIIPRLVWAAAVLTAIAGALVGIGVTLTTNQPPEESALIALVYVAVVAPYGSVVRAIDKLLR